MYTYKHTDTAHEGTNTFDYFHIVPRKTCNAKLIWYYTDAILEYLFPIFQIILISHKFLDQYEVFSCDGTAMTICPSQIKCIVLINIQLLKCPKFHYEFQ